MTPYLNKKSSVFYFTPCKCFFSRTGTKQVHLSCLGFDLCSVYVLGSVVVFFFFFFPERFSEYERVDIDSADHVTSAKFSKI